MASPFKIFRKNAKVLLVGLFLLSMVSFVVIPSFLQWLETQQRRTVGMVVTTTKFGNLSEVQLRALRAERVVVRRFLEALIQKIEELKGNSFRARLVFLTIEKPTEENLVQSWLIAQYAKAAGLKVTDESVNTFIRNLIDASGVPISQTDLINLIRAQGIEENTLFAGLAQELLVLRYMQLLGLDPVSRQPGLTGETPGARWDYFLRFNRMATIELCSFPVEPYIEKVPVPDDRTVRTFFEEHKTRLPDPQSPEPGFKVPAKVTLEYLKADFQKWLINVKISDEELRRVYEQRKDELFLRPAPPPPQASSPSSGSAPSVSGAEPKTGEELPPVVPPSPPSLEVTPPSSPGESPAGQTPAPAQKPGAPSSQAMEPENTPQTEPQSGQGDVQKDSEAERAKGEEMKTESEPQPPPDIPAPSEGSQKRTPIKALLTSYEGETEASGDNPSPAAEEKPPAQEPSAPSAFPSQRPHDAGESSNAPEPAASPSEGMPAATAENAAPSESQSPPEPEGAPATTGATSESPAPDTSKYRPFEEVKDQVRALIVSERIKQTLDEIEEVMRQYQTDRANYEGVKEEAEKAGTTPPSPPARPDLARLAKEKGLDHAVLEDAAIWDLMKQDIAQAIDLQGAPVVRYVFDLAEFLTFRAFDYDNNQYVGWVTAHVREHVPTLDEPGIRDQVIRTWRLQEARKLAEKEVQALAEKVNAARISLTEFCKREQEVSGIELPEPVTTEPFTWLTYGEFGLGRLNRADIRLSSIKTRIKDPASGLVVEKDTAQDLGNEFMAAVFALNEGQAGLAWNQPRTILYLVRAVEFQPSAEQLFERFVRETSGDYLSAAQYDLAEIYQRWMRNLEKDAGLKWVSTSVERLPID